MQVLGIRGRLGERFIEVQTRARIVEPPGQGVLTMTTKDPNKEDRQNKGLDLDASRHGGDNPGGAKKPASDDPRDGLPSVGHDLDEKTSNTSTGFGPDAS